MDAQPRRQRRRQIFSNPAVQVRIVAVFAAIAALYIAVGLWINYRLLASLGGEMTALPVGPALREDIATMLDQQTRVLDVQLGLYTFQSEFTLVMAGVLLSHRIGGPIHHLSSYLQGVADGQVRPREIRFRRGDLFHDLARRFNAFQRSRGILPPEAPEPGGSASDGRMGASR